MKDARTIKLVFSDGDAYGPFGCGPFYAKLEIDGHFKRVLKSAFEYISTGAKEIPEIEIESLKISEDTIAPRISVVDSRGTERRWKFSFFRVTKNGKNGKFDLGVEIQDLPLLKDLVLRSDSPLTVRDLFDEEAVRYEYLTYANMPKSKISAETLSRFETVLERDSRVKRYSFSGKEENAFLYDVEILFSNGEKCSGIFSVGKIANMLFTEPADAKMREKERYGAMEEWKSQKAMEKKRREERIREIIRDTGADISSVQKVISFLRSGVYFDQEDSDYKKALAAVIQNQNEGGSWFDFMEAEG